jgi:hypothetical protein
MKYAPLHINQEVISPCLTSPAVDIRVVLSPVPQMESAIKRLLASTDVNIAGIPSQHLDFGNIALSISKIRLLVITVVLTEALFAEGSREHVV